MDKDHHLVCPKLDHTSKELPKLYSDARRLDNDDDSYALGSTTQN